MIVDPEGAAVSEETVFRAPSERSVDYWEPVIVSGAQLRAAALQLAEGPMPESGRRELLIAHPMATEPGPGLAPGIEVRLSVLKPGEETTPKRHNATEVNFCIGGSGTTMIGDNRFDFALHDVWNHPSWTPYVHRNDARELQIRLTYSNAALLEKMCVHMIDEDPPAPGLPSLAVGLAMEDEPPDPTKVNPYGILPFGDHGALLMPYEILINPPAVPSPAYHWPWVDVKERLDQLTALGVSYRGRRLYLLYNSMTGRTNGTTPNFFATMTVRPPGIVDRPHRHVSAAINYYVSGSGWSRVAGRRYEWKAGDLMLSAPGWAIHNHASNDDGPVYELTVQDQPLHIAMESLLWQEDLKLLPRLLGTSAGFGTNRIEAGVL